MKKGLLPVLVLLLFVSCSRHGIIKGYAFVRRSVAGMVRADDNGRQIASGVTVQHLLFIETNRSEKLPEWTTAWIDQKPYSVQPVKINDYNQVIGRTMDGKQVRIPVKRGNLLWQLVLSPKQDSAHDAAIQEKIMNSKILLSGKWKGRLFTYKISAEKELQQIEFQ